MSSQLNRTIAGIAAAAVLATLLGGCFGGGGNDGGNNDGSTTPQTSTGYFLDSAVAGLSYVSGATSGVTDASGKFTYEVGTTVTFSIGGVTLGTAPAQDTLTPIDLVSGGMAANTSVLNMVRFLMLLDDDNDPANGINIPAAVIAKAASWSAVDFSSASFHTNVAGIVADVVAINSSATLQSSATALTHLQGTFFCANGGGYKGNFAATTGSGNGTWQVVIDPLSGVMAGIGHNNTSGDDFDVSGQLNADATKSFAVGTAGSTASFSGNVATGGAISGTWSDLGGDSGTFSGNKVVLPLPAGATGIAFNGVYQGDELGIYTLAIATDGSILGTGYDGTSNFSITGSMDLTTRAVTMGSTSNGASFTGTMSVDGKTISGSWSASGSTGTFSGCAPTTGFVTGG